MKTGIVATIPEREKTLHMMINSVINQLDLLIVIHKSPTDGMKFFAADHHEGYLFILDDDIEYPPDFVSCMIETVEKYNREAVICCSGKIMKPTPITDFYKDVLIGLETFKELKEDTVVEIPLTCAVCYHTDLIWDLDETEMKHRNMADLNLAVWCKQMDIPIICKAHPANWLTNLMTELPAGSFTIYDSFQKDTSEQTKLINDYL